ncbi:hypothetical protein K466DRAFT_310228 [Polyporus arcularius HHB13444]|uniref:Uncharacterized protein n=1 Tax=Polyporus arcularius HHB13444 TaxID=1314778 RepID=A0A5C3PP84_9APHY|nr:hypothetical protein K466DRAFT_310228 [Polyporus arcularius HHB13444]
MCVICSNEVRTMQTPCRLAVALRLDLALRDLTIVTASEDNESEGSRRRLGMLKGDCAPTHKVCLRLYYFRSLRAPVPLGVLKTPGVPWRSYSGASEGCAGLVFAPAQAYDLLACPCSGAHTRRVVPRNRAIAPDPTLSCSTSVLRWSICISLSKAVGCHDVGIRSVERLFDTCSRMLPYVEGEVAQRHRQTTPRMLRSMKVLIMIYRRPCMSFPSRLSPSPRSLEQRHRWFFPNITLNLGIHDTLPRHP